MNYFIVMVDYGRDITKAAHGLEAVVNPEMTRRGAIEKVREVLGDGKEIAFVHEVETDSGLMSIVDITDEALLEAQALRMEAAE